MIELLAPAKDKLCAKAAIDYGADAVYIGASNFGARKGALNSIEDIKEVVEYAHKFNVKIHVAVNTILNDSELEEAKKLIIELSKINIDAIIIQDMGLLESIKNIEKICIHASTQCNNRDAEKVKFLANIGFSRVILARELSINQIKEIKDQVDIELEAFVHGALCVSYSGQCYLSYAIGGRSANKGECAQPCRKKYSLVDEQGNFIAKDKYLLCLKDFNASNYIKELIEAGVTSFKIEGRLKDIHYVKNVVAYYRKLIDELGYKKTSSGRIIFDFEPDIEKSFNRGFSDYFLNGRKKCYNFETPKSVGKYIGEIKEIKGNFFIIDSDIKIHPQDGLCFFDNNKLKGFLVNKVENNKIYPNKVNEIKIGIKLYRNFDSEFEKKLNNSNTCRKLPIKIDFSMGNIKATDEEGFFVEIDYNFSELAQNPEKMKENIINQLSKSGESIFFTESVKLKTNKLPFLPLSKLNELRRKLLEKLELERLKNYKNNSCNLENKQNVTYPQKEIDFTGNILNKEAKEFYEKHGCKVIEPALESNKCSSSDKFVNKTIMTCRHCLKYAFNLCKSSKKLYLIDEKNKKYNLKFNCDKCEMEIIF